MFGCWAMIGPARLNVLLRSGNLPWRGTIDFARRTSSFSLSFSRSCLSCGRSAGSTSGMVKVCGSGVVGLT